MYLTRSCVTLYLGMCLIADATHVDSFHKIIKLVILVVLYNGISAGTTDSCSPTQPDNFI